MGKYDEEIDYKKEIERLRREKNIFAQFLMDYNYPKEPGENMKKTYDYLQRISVMENLHGDVGRGKNKEILLKYFSNYTFESEDAAKSFMYAFLGKEPVLALKYCRMWSLVKDFNAFYEFHAHIDDDLTMTIVDEVVEKIRPFEDYFK